MMTSEESDAVLDTGEAGGGLAGDPLASRKVIRDATLRIQTLEYDKFLPALEQGGAGRGRLRLEPLFERQQLLWQAPALGRARGARAGRPAGRVPDRRERPLATWSTGARACAT